MSARRPGPRWYARDDGSTIPLILGFFLIALLVIAGSVSAADAFVGQRDVQSICDGATLAAAGAVDLASIRAGAAPTSGPLRLGSVQRAARAYLDRDPERSSVDIDARLSPDGRQVQATCSQTRAIAFGAMFGFGSGVTHVAASDADTDADVG